MNITIITSDYFCKELKRRREIKQVFHANIKLDFVTKYIVLFEDWESVKGDEYSYLSHPKVEVINSKCRQSYKQLFEIGINQTSDSICVIVNSDMMFDKTLQRVGELDFGSKKLFALSRWEPTDKDKSVYTTPVNIRHDMSWSYDSYIFKPQLEIDLSTIDILIGLGGCDNQLVKRLIVDNLIKVENPVNDIRSYHFDYRQEQNLTKDYFDKENYNTSFDYPGQRKPLFKTVQLFGGQFGLANKNSDSTFISENRIFLKKGLKVISFSVYGTDEKYLRGAIKNAELALEIYPEWQCWFYVYDKIDKYVLEELETYPNVKIIKMSGLNWPMTWRFLAIDDPQVEIMCVRDTDSQLSLRERLAVDEWLREGKSLHIMRDHPHHCDKNGHRISGGMWGVKKVIYLPKFSELISKFFPISSQWGADMTLLQKVIYPLFNKYNDIHVTASFNRFESFAKDFPASFSDDFKFVGEYLNWKGERNLDHIKLLKDNLGKPQNSASKLKLSCCLVSSNLNDLYIDFFPLVKTFWNEVVKIKCKMILVADHIPEKLSSYSEDIILFKPENGISDVYQAQMLRVLYASLMQEETGIIVSDMDLIPMQKRYYELCNRFDSDMFVCYRDCLLRDNQFPICFNAASPQIWREIFGIQNESDIRNLLKLTFPRNYRGAPGEKDWFKDQLILFHSVVSWSEKTGSRLVILDDDYTNFNRLDRADWDGMKKDEELKKKITRQEFTDFHLPRPYSQYKDGLLEMLNGLLCKKIVESLK